MSVLAQGLTGLVLALALADMLARQPAGLLALAVARGLLAALALATEGLFLGAGLTALGAGLALPFLVWRQPAKTPPAVPPPVPWPVWAVTIGLIPLSLAVGSLGLPMAILVAGLLALLVRPDGAALALTTMQLGAALVLPALAGMELGGVGPVGTGSGGMGQGGIGAGLGLPATLAACLPVAAGLAILAGRRRDGHDRPATAEPDGAEP